MSSLEWSGEDLTSSAREFDDAAIDSLVDGSLSETERRRLLLQLEATPGGWRRCALAFLEAHDWRQALKPIGCGSPTLPLPAISASRTPSRSNKALPMKPVWRAAIVAIGVAAGWMLGHASRVEFSPPAVDRSNLVADRAASAPAPQPDGPLLPTQAGLPPRESSAPLIRTARRATEGIVSAVPAPLRDHLLREGYRVREQTALTSIALEDGTRVAVPVAQVRLQFIGDTVY